MCKDDGYRACPPPSDNGLVIASGILHWDKMNVIYTNTQMQKYKRTSLTAFISWNNYHFAKPWWFISFLPSSNNRCAMHAAVMCILCNSYLCSWFSVRDLSSKPCKTIAGGGEPHANATNRAIYSSTKRILSFHLSAAFHSSGWMQQVRLQCFGHTCLVGGWWCDIDDFKYVLTTANVSSNENIFAHWVTELRSCFEEGKRDHPEIQPIWDV